MTTHNLKSILPHRPLNFVEDNLLRFLLTVDFPESNILRRQAELLYIEEECSDCLSVGFSVDRTKVEPANVEKTIPVEAEGFDVDGVKIHILLMVVDGYLDEMQVFREDLGTIRKLPSLENLSLV